MSVEDSDRIKKSILMRYPLTFLEEVSRELIGYKSYRDNKKYYRALPILDALIDLVTIDTLTQQRWYDVSPDKKLDEEREDRLIRIDKALVEQFRNWYHGPRPDGKLAIKYLSPGESVDLQRGRVIIRKPVNFMEAWQGYERQDIIRIGGFYYKEQETKPGPFGPITVTHSYDTINFDDRNLKYDQTVVVPLTYWFRLYDEGWSKISGICTMIEKTIAITLENAYYKKEQKEEEKAKAEMERLKL